MADITLGSSEAVEQPGKFGWRPGVGPVNTRIWKGLSSAIIPLSNQLISLGWEINVDKGPTGTIWTLEGTTNSDLDGNAAGQEIVDNWELLPNKVEKDLLESSCDLVNTLTTHNIANLRKLYAEADGNGLNFHFGDNNENCQKVYALMISGVTHWRIFQPVLRHNWIVGNGTRYSPNMQNNGLILTTNTLVSTEGVPGDFDIALDSLNYGAVSSRSGIDLTYGWFKNIPTLNKSSNNRREIHAEWEFGLWSVDLYGSAI